MSTRRTTSPSGFALCGLAAVIAVCIGVRMWGPLNPAIAMSVVEIDVGSLSQGPTEVRRHTTVSIWLANQSHSAVTVLRVRVRIAPDSGSAVGSAPPSLHVGTVTASRSGEPDRQPVPLRLAGGQQADLTATVDVAACHSQATSTVDYDVLVDVRTSAGGVKTITQSGYGQGLNVLACLTR